MEEKSIGLEIKKLTVLMKRNMEKEIGCYDNLTGNHSYILGFLYVNSQKDIFQKDIEKVFSIRRSTATGILNIMEKNSLIERVACTEDSRMKKIVLTEKGKQIQKESFEKIKKFEKKLKANLTENELNQFFIILDKIRSNIEI